MRAFLLETLEKEGCDISQVKTDAQRLTGVVLLGIKDRDTFPLLFYRENCADMALCEDDIDEAFIASRNRVDFYPDVPEALARLHQQWPDARLQWTAVDFNDTPALARFARGCDVLLNCAGPSWRVADRAAQAALKADAHYVDAAGDRIHYVGQGTGEPVLLIHGVGLNKEMWGGQIVGLATDYKVIAYDMLGHGQSQLPAADTPLEGYAAQLAELLDHLQIAQATVIGFSMGGFVARVLTLMAPERVTGVAFVASSARGYSDEETARRKAGYRPGDRPPRTAGAVRHPAGRGAHDESVRHPRPRPRPR